MKSILTWLFIPSVLTSLCIGYLVREHLDQHPGVEELKLTRKNLEQHSSEMTPQLREYLKGRTYSLLTRGVRSEWVNGQIDYGPIDREILGPLSIIKGPESDEDVYRLAMKAAEKTAAKQTATPAAENLPSSENDPDEPEGLARHVEGLASSHDIVTNFIHPIAYLGSLKVKDTSVILDGRSRHELARMLIDVHHLCQALSHQGYNVDIEGSPILQLARTNFKGFEKCEGEGGYWTHRWAEFFQTNQVNWGVDSTFENQTNGNP